jgi:hypothetical protein
MLDQIIAPLGYVIGPTQSIARVTDHGQKKRTDLQGLARVDHRLSIINPSSRYSEEGEKPFSAGIRKNPPYFHPS